uniref:Uncharacterized protein n=1 Tax=Arundo donax TaxID=35708 RepID=A0A0A8ZWF6_ARUDO
MQAYALAVIHLQDIHNQMIYKLLLFESASYTLFQFSISTLANYEQCKCNPYSYPF